MSKIVLAPWLGALLLAVAVPAAARCPPADLDRGGLLALAAEQWQVEPSARRQALALVLLDCLESPDPELRDRLAFEGLSHWARGGLLETAVLLELSVRLQARLRQPVDAAGFGQPFAALALAEVARVDRLTPFLDAAQREALLATAVRYVAGIADYRGYDEREGWRHGVAHGADLLMQLSLNPALDRAQLERLVGAVATQAVADAAHFYVYGEGERLARPVLYAARRGLLPPEFWKEWMQRLVQRATPVADRPLTQASLARVHNLKALYWPLYASVQATQDAAIREALLPALGAVTLP